MPRRIWVAEGVASDGDVYGRALQLPDGRNAAGSPTGDTGVQRRAGTILKNHLGDIPSCPCLAALVTDERLRIPEAADA
ncbi:hypothetical protein [Streptomyces sp. SID13726]|uniref:hypothetical protein n=1 Tax=Streptomyces sp. SID13726 TaxID=2706058 RepID=UPI0013BC8841|nr:hypothetical protein [Streptomyces sp. SID13726]NEA98539.1 hypothetical protein [Streptomyces sp. SID13726]